MAIRKSVDTTFTVDKDRDAMLSDCELALDKGNFKDISTNKTLYTLNAKYKTFTVVGEIEITLLPDGERTSVQVKSTGNVDNIFALFGSPARKIAEVFKSNL
jgi:hypothetical protein